MTQLADKTAVKLVLLLVNNKPRVEHVDVLGAVRRLGAVFTFDQERAIAVVCEMISATEGLGWLIAYASASLSRSQVFAGVAIIAAIGYILFKVTMMLSWVQIKAFKVEEKF